MPTQNQVYRTMKSTSSGSAMTRLFCLLTKFSCSLAFLASFSKRQAHHTLLCVGSISTEKRYEQLPLTTSATTDGSLSSVAHAKRTLIEQLQRGVDDNDPALLPMLDILKQSYADSQLDARLSTLPSYNGDWKNVNTPAFPGRLGFHEDHRLPLYKIGSLTFGLIPDAKHVVVAVEKMVQHVHWIPTAAHGKSAFPADQDIPESLHATVMAYPQQLRTNQIDTVFQIPGSPVRGILRMEGYTVPNPQEPNRYDTWFLGGRCIPDKDRVDPEAWSQVFGDAWILEYALQKPVTAYQTVVYLDEDLRISIGNRGSVMIVGRDTTTIEV